MIHYYINISYVTFSNRTIKVLTFYIIFTQFKEEKKLQVIYIYLFISKHYYLHDVNLTKTILPMVSVLT